MACNHPNPIMTGERLRVPFRYGARCLRCGGRGSFGAKTRVRFLDRGFDRAACRAAIDANGQLP